MIGVHARSVLAGEGGGPSDDPDLPPPAAAGCGPCHHEAPPTIICRDGTPLVYCTKNDDFQGACQGHGGIAICP